MLPLISPLGFSVFQEVAIRSSQKEGRGLVGRTPHFPLPIPRHAEGTSRPSAVTVWGEKRQEKEDCFQEAGTHMPLSQWLGILECGVSNETEHPRCKAFDRDGGMCVSLGNQGPSWGSHTFGTNRTKTYPPVIWLTKQISRQLQDYFVVMQFRKKKLFCILARNMS